MGHKSGIFLSALIVAIGGIIYELMISTASSYLLGNSVKQFSITIGLMLFAMGIGSYVAPMIKQQAETQFVWVETLLALIGGNAVMILFFAYGFTEWYYLVLIFLILLIGILIGLEIPILLRMLQKKEDMIAVTSRVLSLDYVGALVASVLYPIVLLPYLGLLRTSYMVGLLNAGIAVMIFWSFRPSIRGKRWLSFFLGITVIGLTVGLMNANMIAWGLDHRLYQDEVIYSEQSLYQKIVITQFKDDVRLFLDGNIQFSSVDEHRYHELLIHLPMGFVREPRSVLVLGGGDGLGIRELLKYKDVDSIELVDLDPAMTRLGREHASLVSLNQSALSDPRVVIVNADAFEYLEQSTKLYDVIVIDLPDPNNEGLAKLYSKEFYDLVARHLSAEGVMVTQATSPYFATDTFWLIDRTIAAADLYTLPYHFYVPSFGEWGFVIGSPRQLESQPMLADVPMRVLNAETAEQAITFDADMLVPAETGTVNTIFNPIILYTYEHDFQRWYQ